MPNMSYCRFQNTVGDLKGCAENIDAELSEAEHAARKRLMRHCASILRSAGMVITKDQLAEALQEVETWQ